MAWEEREHSRNVYYTRSRRVGGRVVRLYVGSGPKAKAAAADDAQERRLREEQRERLRQQADEARATDEGLSELGRLSDLLAQVVLWPAGYHKHRGEWRKKRGLETDNTVN